MLAPFSGGNGIGQGLRRLANTGRADQQGVGSTFEATAKQLVKLGIAAWREISHETPVMLSRDQSRKNVQPAFLNSEIMKSAAELYAAHLDDTKPAAFSAILDRQLLQQHNAVRKRMQLKIVGLRGEVVQHDHGTMPGGEKVL